MRLRRIVPALAALALALGGCSVLGYGPAGPPGVTASVSPPPSGPPWIVTATGSATPSPGVPGRGSPSPALPPVSFLPLHPECAADRRIGEVLIPIAVTPGRGSLRLTWPRQYDSGYRITAVPQQPLKTGEQPAYTWQAVAAGTGCTVTATISGLRSGTPYVVWLDAPNTGYERDGTRHLYSGRSGVVYPL